MQKDYSFEHEQMRKELWCNAWCDVANAINCSSADSATKWADAALKDFDSRFPVPVVVKNAAHSMNDKIELVSTEIKSQLRAFIENDINRVFTFIIYSEYSDIIISELNEAFICHGNARKLNCFSKYCEIVFERL